MANSEDVDEVAHYLHCLQIQLFLSLVRLKELKVVFFFCLFFLFSHFYCITHRHSCKLAVQTLIRRRVLNLIYTVCTCPLNDDPVYKGLTKYGRLLIRAYLSDILFIEFFFQNMYLTTI